MRDVDFGLNKKKPDSDIPFWRRQGDQQQLQHSDKRDFTRDIRPDVSVNLHESWVNQRFNTVDLGKDTISEKHKQLLFQLSKGPVSVVPSTKQSSTLALDKAAKHIEKMTNKFATPEEQRVSVSWDTQQPDNAMEKKTIFLDPVRPLKRKNISETVRKAHSEFNLQELKWEQDKTMIPEGRSNVDPMKVEVKEGSSLQNLHEDNGGSYGVIDVPPPSELDMSVMEVDVLANILNDVSSKITAKEQAREYMGLAGDQPVSLVQVDAQQDQILFQKNVGMYRYYILLK